MPRQAHTPLSREDDITLQVRDQAFIVRAGTLCDEALYFEAAMFGPAAGAMQGLSKTADGAFVVEADPDVFKHIVEYCQYLTCPLFHDKGCFNYSLYASLLKMARYYHQVTKLASWIATNQFESALTSTAEVEHCGVKDLSSVARADTDGGTKRKWVGDRSYISYRQRKLQWICPMGIDAHTRPYMRSGGHNVCGMRCERDAKGRHDFVDADMVAVVTKRTSIDFDALVPDS